MLPRNFCYVVRKWYLNDDNHRLSLVLRAFYWKVARFISTLCVLCTDHHLFEGFSARALHAQAIPVTLNVIAYCIECIAVVVFYLIFATHKECSYKHWMMITIWATMKTNFVYGRMFNIRSKNVKYWKRLYFVLSRTRSICYTKYCVINPEWVSVGIILLFCWGASILQLK